MLEMTEVASESMDAVFSSHNIEHLYPHEVPTALAEFLRVLKPDGFAVIICPDLQSVAMLIAEDKLCETAYVSPSGPVTPLDILYGHRPKLAAGKLFMAHRCGFTQKVLNDTLSYSGFQSVLSSRRDAPCFDLRAIASKPKVPDARLFELAGAHFPE
jgi:predicted SAM-dependent methyltransferase